LSSIAPIHCSIEMRPSFRRTRSTAQSMDLHEAKRAWGTCGGEGKVRRIFGGRHQSDVCWPLPLPRLRPPWRAPPVEGWRRQPPANITSTNGRLSCVLAEGVKEGGHMRWQRWQKLVTNNDRVRG